MQLTILTVPFFAALAVAMPPPTLDWLDAKAPDCGRGCLNKGYKAVGCDIKDYQCRCDRGRQLLNTAPYTTLHCIEANCNSKEHDRLNAAYETICQELVFGNSNWFNKTFELPPGLVDP